MNIKNAWRLFPFHLYCRILFFVVLAGFSSDLLKKLSSPYSWWGLGEEPAWKHSVIWRNELPDSLKKTSFPVIGIYSDSFIARSAELCSDLSHYANLYRVEPISVFNYPHPAYLEFCAHVGADAKLFRYQYWLDTTGLRTVRAAIKALKQSPPAFIAYQNITGVIEAYSVSYAGGRLGAGQIMAEFIEALTKERYLLIKTYSLDANGSLFLYIRSDFAKEKSNAF